ncbi:MAG: hypothetical protein OJF49_001583 [Ktedonobacterales bacterium]|jgi:CheY-like chemotaxis protein|nr:MAG: hypothetical protein OJF49_001583 [Ktedonobacterales bacterium]
MGHPSGGTEPTVLVVDDNADLLALVANSLRKLGGFSVATATNGAEGLQCYFEVRPACVVVDVKMPGLDGYQLIRALRGDPDSSATPIIVLSAMVQDRDKLAGLLAGADAYLLKPISPLDLVSAVRQALARTETQRQQRLRALLDDTAESTES